MAADVHTGKAADVHTGKASDVLAGKAADAAADVAADVLTVVSTPLETAVVTTVPQVQNNTAAEKTKELSGHSFTIRKELDTTLLKGKKKIRRTTIQKCICLES